MSRQENWTPPINAPYYPPLPAHYRNVRFQFVFFQADPESVADFLPEPLTPSSDGLCVAIGIHVPFCTAYGSFNEAVLQQKCVFRGQEGWFCSHVWHDGPEGIAAGREIYGTPKIYAGLQVDMQGQAMRSVASIGGLPVISIQSTLEQPANPDAIPAISPSWRLKIIPRADGPGPAIKQLIDGSCATLNFQPGVCFEGRGVVVLSPSALCDVSPLKPLRFFRSYYLEASYSETYARVVYDYLAG